jgi:hypothetical protein
MSEQADLPMSSAAAGQAATGGVPTTDSSLRGRVILGVGRSVTIALGLLIGAVAGLFVALFTGLIQITC